MAEPFSAERTIVSNDVVVWEMTGTPSEEEWRKLMDAAAMWLLEQESRGKRWGVIVDPSRMENVSAELRKMAGEWRARNMALIANTCTCASYVASSPVLRGAITAVFWFAKPVIPVSVRGTQEEAHQWVVTKLNDLTMTA